MLCNFLGYIIMLLFVCYLVLPMRFLTKVYYGRLERIYNPQKFQKTRHEIRTFHASYSKQDAFSLRG